MESTETKELKKKDIEEIINMDNTFIGDNKIPKNLKINKTVAKNTLDTTISQARQAHKLYPLDSFSTSAGNLRNETDLTKEVGFDESEDKPQDMDKEKMGDILNKSGYEADEIPKRLKRLGYTNDEEGKRRLSEDEKYFNGMVEDMVVSRDNDAIAHVDDITKRNIKVIIDRLRKQFNNSEIMRILTKELKNSEANNLA